MLPLKRTYMDFAAHPLFTVLVGLQVVLLACIIYGTLKIWKSVFPCQSDRQPHHDPEPDLEKGKTPFLRRYQED